MNRRYVLAGALATSAFLAPPPLSRRDDAAFSRAIRAYYDPLARMQDVSGKLRIERGGRITEEWYGFPNWTARSSWGPHTRFACASVTKSMTATILLKLAQQGELQLSDAVSAHLPDYQHGQSMSLEHVIRHTSGLQRNIPDEERPTLGAGGVIGWLNAHPPTAAPGASESYSNLGYEVLALVAERVSGKSFAELAQLLIFNPLRMVNSSMETTSIAPMGATPHVPGPPPNEVRADSGTPLPAGAAGLFASMDDLVIWARAVRDGTIVQLKQADGRYLGSVLSFEEAGKSALFLQGTIRGSGAGVAVFPGEADDVVVAYQLNLESYPQLSAQRVLTKLAFNVDPDQPELRPPAAPLTDAHRALAGTYESGAFGQLRIYERDGEMRVLMLGLGIDQYATPVADGRLSWRTFNFTFSPRRDEAGALTGLNVAQTMFDAGEAGRVMNRVE